MLQLDVLNLQAMSLGLLNVFFSAPRRKEECFET